MFLTLSCSYKIYLAVVVAVAAVVVIVVVLAAVGEIAVAVKLINEQIKHLMFLMNERTCL